MVEDEGIIRQAVARHLKSDGYLVDLAESWGTAETLFRANRPDVALLDDEISDGRDVDVLRRLDEICPGVPAIVMTANRPGDPPVEAIQDGAPQFLRKPVDLPALGRMVERLVDNRHNGRPYVGRGRGSPCVGPDPFFGASKVVRSLAAECRAILNTDSTVLILGETGAGKGVLARWIHESGPRAGQAFVDVNCAGLPRDLLETELFGHEAGAFTGAARSKRGLLDIADGGTLFLDEIGDLDPQVQPKLLNVIEEKRFRRLGDVRSRRVDIRLITAAYQDLGRLVREGKFRQDLYFRIHVFPISVPPLRERREDIPLLARQLLAELARDLGRGPFTLSVEAERRLQAHDWPGNIRELRNVLERTLLMTSGPVLEAAELRLTADSGDVGDPLRLEQAERQAIEKALRGEQGRVASAARRLGISKTTLYQKIKRYRLGPTAESGAVPSRCSR